MKEEPKEHPLSEAELKFVKRVVAKTNDIYDSLKRVMPEASDDLVGVVAHDLGDFWEIAENHRTRVEEILTLRGSQDKLRLAELLTDLFYGDVKGHLPNHVESMDETLPSLIEKLEEEAKK